MCDRKVQICLMRQHKVNYNLYPTLYCACIRSVWWDSVKRKIYSVFIPCCPYSGSMWWVSNYFGCIPEAVWSMEADEGRVGLEERGEGLVYVIDMMHSQLCNFLRLWAANQAVMHLNRWFLRDFKMCRLLIAPLLFSRGPFCWCLCSKSQREL